MKHTGEELLSHLPELVRYATRFVAPSEAEDVALEAIARACEKGGEIAGDLKPWLFRVCHNVAVDRIRARAGRRVHQIDDAVDFAAPEAVEYVTRDQKLRERQLRALNAAYSTFKDPARAEYIYTHRYLRSMTAAEIAARLGCTRNAVKMTLHDVRKRAREIFERGA